MQSLQLWNFSWKKYLASYISFQQPWRPFYLFQRFGSKSTSEVFVHSKKSHQINFIFPCLSSQTSFSLWANLAFKEGHQWPMPLSQSLLESSTYPYPILFTSKGSNLIFCPAASKNVRDSSITNSYSWKTQLDVLYPRNTFLLF